jgi:hypothetical protein
VCAACVPSESHTVQNRWEKMLHYAARPAWSIFWSPRFYTTSSPTFIIFPIHGTNITICILYTVYPISHSLWRSCRAVGLLLLAGYGWEGAQQIVDIIDCRPRRRRAKRDDPDQFFLVAPAVRGCIL